MPLFKVGSGVNNAKIRGKSIKKSPQQSCLPPISQISTDFLPLKVTQIFYFFTFKSHADFADDADFLPFYFFTFLPLKVLVPRRSHPAKLGEGFDGPPTL